MNGRYWNSFRIFTAWHRVSVHCSNVRFCKKTELLHLRAAHSLLGKLAGLKPAVLKQIRDGDARCERDGVTAHPSRQCPDTGGRDPSTKRVG
jgi:hypothetical protein